MNTEMESMPLGFFGVIPEKEMLMYKAVIDMVQEDKDINSITVSDITRRAGIGKGTAYEYFSSKEEIIVKALFYDTYTHIRNVENIFKKASGFKDKYYLLMDYLEEKIPYTKGVGSLLRLFSGAYDIKGRYKEELEKFHVEENCPLKYVENLIDSYMKQGYDEGVFVQENISLRRSVFATQITGYIYCILNGYYAQTMSRELARDFSYECVVKILNP